MRLTIADDAVEASRAVVAAVVARLRQNCDLVLGLAAGRTPLEAYDLLAGEQPPIHRLSVVVLDEYHGVRPDQDGSFRHLIRSRLTDRLGLDPARVHSLDGLAADPIAECQRFEATIAGLGGVDLQLLGLGRNGHIGFNEPGSRHDSRTRPVLLAATTRADNAPFFSGSGGVPQQALTQGIGTILEARSILLLATGSHKAAAVAAVLEGPVSEAVPASALRRHPDCSVVVDQAAATLLTAAG